MSFMGSRFLTLNSVIRVNQIEITRDQTAGMDESAKHTPENVAALRDTFGRGWPGGRMTWALSWQALHDPRPNYRRIRDLVAGYHHQFGDEVTFIPGGFFANAYNSREQINRDLHEALQVVSSLVGGGYRPRSIVAGFLAAENLRFLAEEEDIHVCQGNIWSQYAIDNQDGDGSICYPYYPSREHFCKPAQGENDFIDCVNLDGWTCDFLAARRAGYTDGPDGYNSRMGLGPIETIGALGVEVGVRQMLATMAAHFDTGCSLNGFGWVTACWEASLISDAGYLEGLFAWLKAAKSRWPDASCITQGEFGMAWRQTHADNSQLNYRFRQQGSGIRGSDADKVIHWYMNQKFRLATLASAANPLDKHVIDLTRYDLQAQEPADMTRLWSLLGTINQKQIRPQDRPRRLNELSADDQARIFSWYPELKDAQ